MLSLKGATVTADAINCQRAIAAQVVGQGSDYALALRGNQGTLHDDVVRFLDDPLSAPATSKLDVDAGHGRVERASGALGSQRGHAERWQMRLARLLRDTRRAIDCGDAGTSAQLWCSAR